MGGRNAKIDEKGGGINATFFLRRIFVCVGFAYNSVGMCFLIDFFLVFVFFPLARREILSCFSFSFSSFLFFLFFFGFAMKWKVYCTVSGGLEELAEAEAKSLFRDHPGFYLFYFICVCFVLFCFVLFCFVLFCFVLFCFVLFYFILFCFVFV